MLLTGIYIIIIDVLKPNYTEVHAFVEYSNIMLNRDGGYKF